MSECVRAKDHEKRGRKSKRGSNKIKEKKVDRALNRIFNHPQRKFIKIFD